MAIFRQASILRNLVCPLGTRLKSGITAGSSLGNEACVSTRRPSERSEIIELSSPPAKPPAGGGTRELGLREEVVVFHSSNHRPGKRIDLLPETVARVRPRDTFKLLILAGGPFAPFAEHVREPARRF